MKRRLLSLCAIASLLAAALFAFPPPRDEVVAATRQEHAGSPAAHGLEPIVKEAASAGPTLDARSDRPPSAERSSASPASAWRDDGEPGNLFAVHAPPRPRAAPPKPAPVVAAAPPAPPPALPYRYLGRYGEKGAPAVFVLAKDRAVPIHPGDVLDGMFRVESIDDEHIVFVHEPTDQRLKLSTTEGAR